MVFNEAFIQSIIPQVRFRGQPLPADVTWALDSRTVTEQSPTAQSKTVFVALRGSQTDGHNFVAEALRAGACGCLVSLEKEEELSALMKQYQTTKTFILVPSPEQALYELAAAWRQQFTYPVVGITGSVGKTTTKTMLANVLRAQGRPFLASEGNQNTLLGASINILRMKPEHTVAVFEMGISRRGEMARLAQLVRPTIGVITALGHCHMEGLGSLADIAAEKRDVFSAFTPDCIGIIDGDQPLLATVSYAQPIIRFGKKMSNQIQARKIELHTGMASFQLKIYQERYPITLQTEHLARIYNALTVAAISHVLGIEPSVMCKGLQEPVAVSGRFKKYEIASSGSVVIDDSYNANPESMKAALLAFEKVEAPGKKIAVLGDMLELGVNAPFWHRQLGRFLRKVPSVQEVVFVGEQVKWAQKLVPLHMMSHHVASWEEAAQLLKDRVARDKTIVLVKGSLGMRLRNLVHVLTGQK